MYGKIKEHLSQTLAEIREAGLYKEERLIESPQRAAIEVAGKEVLNFCANNYLGLSDNKRIIEGIRHIIGGPEEKYPTIIEKYGNTAGISIPLTLVENKEKINPNDVILANAIGAGFVFGSAIFNLAGCQMLEMKEY